MLKFFREIVFYFSLFVAIYYIVAFVASFFFCLDGSLYGCGEKPIVIISRIVSIKNNKVTLENDEPLLLLIDEGYHRRARNATTTGNPKVRGEPYFVIENVEDLKGKEPGQYAIIYYYGKGKAIIK